MTSDQIEDAYLTWRTRHPFPDEENRQPSFGWLRRARQALLLSAYRVAKNLGVSRAALYQLENRDERGAITLANMEKVAEAMGCELICYLKPKGEKSFSRHLWNQIWPHAIKHPWVITREGKNRVKALVAVANWQLEEPAFRRARGWSQRRGRPTVV